MSFLRKTYLKILIGTCLLISGWFYLGYGIEGYNFYGDALGYYMYLPNTFIYHNHKSVEKLPEDRGIRPFIHGYAAQIGSGQRGPKGYVINQYTYGMALMETPFFLAAHTLEKARGSQANGFSESYRKAVDLSTLVYGVLGLGLCYHLLRRRFSAGISGLVVALLLVGTNLFWFMFRQQGMAHVPLFFLFALLLKLTVRVHKSGRWRDFAALGCVAGLITLIRPVDGLCVLIPVLYVKGRPYLRSLLQFGVRHRLKIVLAGACFILPIVPQLLYWKWLTGYWVYDSYGPGQGFNFRHPAIWSGLFGASNGWLFYTPLMITAVAGLLMPRRLMGFGIAAPVVLGLYVWAVYAWFLPNYINGFGSRPMIDVYALLAIPMAAFLEWLYRRKALLRAAGAICILFFIAWNLSASVQQARGLLLSQDSKYRFNFQTAFRQRLRYDDLVVWDIGLAQPELAKLRPAAAAHCVSFSDSAFNGHIRDSAGTAVYHIGQDEEYPPLRLRRKAGSLRTDARWLCGSGIFKLFQPGDDIYRQSMLVLQVRRGDSTLHWYGVRIGNKLGLLEDNVPAGGATLGAVRQGLRGEIRYVVPVPAGLWPEDEIQLDVWNMSRQPMEVSRLCLQELN